MEICADQGDEEGVKEPVDELKIHLRTFVYIRFGQLHVIFLTGWAQPSYVCNLGSVSTNPYSSRKMHTCMFCVT